MGNIVKKTIYGTKNADGYVASNVLQNAPMTIIDVSACLMDDSTDVSTELMSTTNEISCSQDWSLKDGFCEFKLHVSIRNVQFHRKEQLKIKENYLSQLKSIDVDKYSFPNE